MPKPKLIVASTRLPVTMSRRASGWTVEESAGGLVTALKAVNDRTPFTWLGWPGAQVPAGEQPAVTRELARHGASPVFIGKADLDGFYEGFANGVLWPLFHNMLDRSHFDRASWDAFQHVNARYADAVAEIAKPGDLIWIHDYQLALVPQMLRQRGLGCPVGFFLHIPFPSAEAFRTMPVAAEVLRGLLGADLMGFHAYEYVSHFRMACLRVLGVESEPKHLRLQSRSVRLTVLPIGIDPAEIRSMCSQRAAQQEFAELSRAYAGKRLIVGVDRLDYTKGIPQRLLAFEELLRVNAKWRDKVVLVQVAAPSRTGVADYQALKREVDELVGRINGRYGSSSHTPVVHINQNVSRERLTGLYRAAEIALIAPLRDGMNLVALEYVAARDQLGGTLILSEFTGAAHCLAGARLVNPYNIENVAAVLHEALESEGGDMEAFRHMLKFVDENTSMRWANMFLDRLEAVAGTDHMYTSEILSLRRADVAARVATAKRPLVFLDYDGTLRSYVIDPREAVPDQRILDALRRLAAVATVYVVSGRDRATLEAWLGHLPLGLVCEHGLAIREPGQSEWTRRTSTTGTTLRKLVRPVFDDFVRRTPGSSVEQKDAALAWHYRAADPEYGVFQARELLTRLEDLLKRKPYRVLRGNRVIEVRHEQVSKGHAVRDVLERMPKTDFVFCAGDDTTDEDMMAAIAKRVTVPTIRVWVGKPNPSAEFWRESTDALLGDLEAMARAWKRVGLGSAKAGKATPKRLAKRRRSGPGPRIKR